MKKIIFPVVLFFAVSTSFCQSFMQGAGVAIFVGASKGGDFSFSEGLTYSPRFNFVESESLSLSVGIPISLAISATTDLTNSGEASIGVMVNAPVIVNLNMGRGSTRENTRRFGYFVGAGLGFHHGDYIKEDFYSGSTSGSVNAFGPAANAGVRIGVGKKHRNVEVRLSYMKGLDASKINIVGLAGLFNF